MPTPSSQPNPSFDFAEPSNRTPPVPDAFKSSPPGSLTKYEPPPATPIYPHPINRPISPPAYTPPPSPPPAPASASASTRSVSRSGGRIAGSFKMPPGAGVAARTSAGIVGRRVPYVALAFLAYDAYQLACALQLIPGSVCPRPDNPNPGGTSPGFSGGQCAGTPYDVMLVYQSSGLSPNPITTGPVSANGAIVGLRKRTAGGTDVYVLVSDGGLTARDLFSIPSPSTASITSITPKFGLPDNCGNPQPQPQPQRLPDQINNITNNNNNINLNFNVPSPRPPSPQPKPAPRVIAPPSPFPDININFGDNYFGGGDTDYDFDIDFNFSPAPKGNFNDYPDIFNNFPPSPRPQTRDPDPFPKENPPPQPAPQPKPLPEIPPPIPDKLPENSTEQDKYIYRQNKETLDKVYKANAEILEIQKEQEKQRKILENIQSLLDFEVQGEQIIKRCDDIEIFYSYKDKILKAINKQLDHVKMIEQTLINEVCSIEADTVAAVPEWWQVRLQANVPQIALIFRVAATRHYHKITIPHPLNTSKLVNPPIQTYKKGNWQGEIVCVDNSKFLVNCETKIEAERVVNIAVSLIHPDWLGNTPRLYFAERKGVEVARGNMIATSAMYFFQGQQNAMPDWRVAFKKDGK